jgi:hypothetical protein
MTTTIITLVDSTELEVTEVGRNWEPGGIAVEYVDAEGNHHWRTERIAQSHR